MEEPARAADVKLVLLGRRGSGKSCCGNTILGRTGFKTLLSTTPVTTQCQKETLVIEKRRVTVIDTPDFYGDLISDPESHIETCKSWTAEGPCVFLLVLQLGHFTEGENMIIQQTERTFGPDVTHRMMILFSYGDDLEDITIENFLMNAHSDLQALIAQCGNRYHVFNNRDTSDKQVKELLAKVNMLKSEGRDCSTQRSQIYLNDHSKAVNMRKTAVENLNKKLNEDIDAYNINMNNDRTMLECNKSESLKKLNVMLEKLKNDSKIKEKKEDETAVWHTSSMKRLSLDGHLKNTYQRNYSIRQKFNTIRGNQEMKGIEEIREVLERSVRRTICAKRETRGTL